MKSGPTGNRHPVLGRMSRRHRAAAGLTALALATAGVVTLIGSAQAADTLLSQGKAVTASSTENPANMGASAAVDGNTGSRWGSQFSDAQWLQVDLGATAAIDKVELTWETAYAKAFQLQTSTDAKTWTTVYSTTDGKGGLQDVAVKGDGSSARYVRMNATARGTQYGYSLWEFQVFGSGGAATTTPTPTASSTPVGSTDTGSTATPTVPATAAASATPSASATVPATTPPVSGFNPNLGPGESITLSTPTQPIQPDRNFVPAPDTYHHEFQANCPVTETKPNDPIVYPGLTGASHMHTFMGATTTDAFSTTASLFAGGTACVTPADHSGYWFPSLYNGDKLIEPTGPQVIYYKSGVYDYRTVLPFPKGLRYVVGNAKATSADQFKADPGAVEGWECGDSSKNWDFPANCPAGTQLNVRMQSPSCWDGVHLDSPDHKSHMAYPVPDQTNYGRAICPADHPVALPMIEFKMAFPTSGDMSKVRLSSGAGYTWHYDVFNVWDPTILAPLVKHCINGGLQCTPRGNDIYKPERGGVLDENYQLLPNVK